MTIQHVNIPDAQIHEPKGVVSAANKTAYIANGSGSGSWRKIKESDIDYTSAADNQYGWNDISDNLYTSSSPRSIASATRTQLTNNGAAVQSNTTRLGAIWSTVNNRFDINDLNSSYLIRVTLKLKAAAAASTPYTFKLDLESNSGPFIIAGQDMFIKGGSYENHVTCTFPIYMGAVINNLPLKLYVTADTAITIYDIGFFVQRLYKES